MSAASATGFYGKLPCKGDFIQRRVPQEFVDVWDAWLQQCLHASRGRLGEQWLDAYLTGPIWRFALAEGACGAWSCAGLMLPSVDRVGRYFPLAIVAPLDEDTPLIDIAGPTGKPWFDAAESLALDALQATDLDLDSFDEQLAALPAPGDAPALADAHGLASAMRARAFVQGESRWHVSLGAGFSLERTAAVFAALEWQRTLRPLALWWTDGSNAVERCSLLSRGLPPPEQFVSMLAGAWAAMGWPSVAAGAPENPGSGAPLEEPQQVAARPPAESASVFDELAAPLEIAAFNPPVRRLPDARSALYFTTRPELGLWGLAYGACAPGGLDPAQRVMDAVCDFAPSGRLAAAVEAVRRSLRSVESRGEGAGESAGAEVGAIFLLAQDKECALVGFGGMRAVRLRAAQAQTIASFLEVRDPAPLAQQPEAGGTGLLALLSAPAHAESAIGVHYERLEAGDVWLLGAAEMLEDSRLARIEEALSPEAIAGGTALDVLLRACAAPAGGAQPESPLMLLAVRRLG